MAGKQNLHSMRPLVVIQSRLSSHRLPAKGLLTVGKLPSVVLCAKRASNTGLNVVVATSDEPSDDPTAEVLETYQIPCFRGDLNHVLKRLVDASSSLPSGGVIIRLTADNVFPDGAFLDELCQTFQKSTRLYLGTSSPQDGLPYGLSAEIMQVDVLREAYEQTQDPHDCEHVTPWVRRKYNGTDIFRPKILQQDLSCLRCTMDDFEDYLRVYQVFRDIQDPVNVSWPELCQILGENNQLPD